MPSNTNSPQSIFSAFASHPIVSLDHTERNNVTDADIAILNAQGSFNSFSSETIGGMAKYYTDLHINALSSHYVERSIDPLRLQCLAPLHPNMHILSDTLLHWFEANLDNTNFNVGDFTLLIPMGLPSKGHWVLLVLTWTDLTLNSVIYFDSLGCDRVPDEVVSELRLALPNLVDEDVIAHPGVFQHDSFNCGPWVVYAIEQLASSCQQLPTPASAALVNINLIRQHHAGIWSIYLHNSLRLRGSRPAKTKPIRDVSPLALGTSAVGNTPPATVASPPTERKRREELAAPSNEILREHNITATDTTSFVLTVNWTRCSPGIAQSRRKRWPKPSAAIKGAIGDLLRRNAPGCASLPPPVLPTSLAATVSIPMSDSVPAASPPAISWYSMLGDQCEVLNRTQVANDPSILKLRVHCPTAAIRQLIVDYITTSYVDKYESMDPLTFPMLSITEYRPALAQCLITGWLVNGDGEFIDGRIHEFMTAHMPESCQYVVRKNADDFPTAVLCFLPPSEISTLHRALSSIRTEFASYRLKLTLLKRVKSQQTCCTFCWSAGHSSSGCPHRSSHAVAACSECYAWDHCASRSRPCRPKAAVRCRLCDAFGHSTVHCSRFRPTWVPVNPPADSSPPTEPSVIDYSRSRSEWPRPPANAPAARNPTYSSVVLRRPTDCPAPRGPRPPPATVRTGLVATTLTVASHKQQASEENPVAVSDVDTVATVSDTRLRPAALSLASMDSYMQSMVAQISSNVASSIQQEHSLHSAKVDSDIAELQKQVSTLTASLSSLYGLIQSMSTNASDHERHRPGPRRKKKQSTALLINGHLSGDPPIIQLPSTNQELPSNLPLQLPCSPQSSVPAPMQWPYPIPGVAHLSDGISTRLLPPTSSSVALEAANQRCPTVESQDQDVDLS